MPTPPVAGEADTPSEDRYPGQVSELKQQSQQALEFYRSEVHFEFGLLGTRATMLVGCQSFLVVPFGILHSSSAFGLLVGLAVLLIAALGAWVAWVLWGPMETAHRAIDEWVMRCRVLLTADSSLKVLTTGRDRKPGVERNIKQDADHIRSLAFTRQAPLAFLCFWASAGALTVTRLVVARGYYATLPDFMLGR